MELCWQQKNRRPASVQDVLELHLQATKQRDELLDEARRLRAAGTWRLITFKSTQSRLAIREQDMGTSV